MLAPIRAKKASATVAYRRNRESTILLLAIVVISATFYAPTTESFSPSAGTSPLFRRRADAAAAGPAPSSPGRRHSCGSSAPRPPPRALDRFRRFSSADGGVGGEERTGGGIGSDGGSNGKAEKDAAPGPSSASSDGGVPLSDVDARVLRSILEEQKLDLQTEDSVKKLLERGTAPPPPPRAKAAKEQEGNGKYASTVLKAVSDNAFWNSLKAKTEEILDSAKIYLSNRIERDAKLLASVGLFALDRAKRDVGRALPQSGRTGAAVGRAMRKAVRQLAANSSFAEYVPEDNFILPPSKYSESADTTTSVYDELNTPLDEIKSVTESIRDILAGKTTVTSGADGGGGGSGGATRGLRSVAPSGMSRGAVADRQRRAYQRRKETILAREKEGIDKKLGRTVGAVADSAAELKREFTVEGKKAGYRSEAAVKAIEAGAATVLLEAGQAGEGWGQLPLGMGQRLFGARQSKEDGGPARAELREATIVAPVLTRDDLLEEKARLAASLRVCLETPSETWLMPGVVADKMENNTFNEEALKDVITTMICARDDTEIDDDRTKEEEPGMDEIISELQSMKGMVDTIISLAAVAAGYDAAERLKGELIGQPAGYGAGDDLSLVASLDEIVRNYDAAKVQQEAAAAAEAADAAARAKAEAAAAVAASVSAKEPQRMDYTVSGDFTQAVKKAETIDSAVIDAVVIADPTEKKRVEEPVPSVLGSEDEIVDALFSSAMAVEVVTDDELSDDFRDVKAVASVSDVEEVEEKEEKESVAVTILLRSLDVVLFVAEKTFFVGVPVVFRSGKNVASRLNKERRNGLGSEGWDTLENVQDGARRY